MFGVNGISTVQLLIILAIIIMIFGTKKIRNLGWDLGSAVKGVRHGFKEAKEGLEELEPEMQATLDDAEDAGRRIRGLKKKVEDLK